jgi:hypothetical protein
MASIYAFEIPETHSELAREFALAGLAVTDTKRIVYGREETIIDALKGTLRSPRMSLMFTEGAIQSPFWSIPLEIVVIEKTLMGLILPVELMTTLHALGSQVFDASGKLTPRRKLISSNLFALEEAFNYAMSEWLDMVPSGIPRQLPL